MLRFAVCDDTDSVCKYIEDFLIEVSTKQKLLIAIDTYHSGKELIVALENKNYDCILLDIEIGETNGIEVGRFLREELNNEKTEIIFISAHRQYAIELFDFDPLTFLIKPIDNDSLTKAFNKLLKRMGRSEKVFSIKHGCEYKKIPVNDILYFESTDHKISMHTDSGIELFYDKLDNIILRLDSKLFIQIHKSFIVNSRRIKRFCYDTVVLDNDEVLPIAQSKRKSVRTWLLKNYKDGMV